MSRQAKGRCAGSKKQQRKDAANDDPDSADAPNSSPNHSKTDKKVSVNKLGEDKFNKVEESK